MRRFLHRYGVLLAAVVLSALKVALSCGLPLCVHATASYDDAWAVNAAYNMGSGAWLGPYDDITLIKNPGFPLYLALLGKLQVSYLLGTALLYVGAAAFFCAALRPLVRDRRVLLVVYVLLLFNPVSLSTDTFQRVYRNSVTAAQALLVFGAYLGVYVRCKGLGRLPGESLRLREVAPWMLVGAVSLAWFWVSREDSIWMAPLAVVATLVIVAVLLRSWWEGRRARDPQRVCHTWRRPVGTATLVGCLVLTVLPLVMTYGGVQAVKHLNEERYGVAVTAEINSGNFARFIKDLYAIEPQVLPENLHVACPHSSVQAAYTVSPTLASIGEQVEERFYNWGDVYDNDPGDGEVNGGEFFWVFRLAGSQAGVYAEGAVEADAFWGRCADELEAAFEEGILPQRATLPSSIMTPWRSEYASLLVPTAVSVYAQACSYADVSAAPYPAQGSEEGVHWFEQVTGNRAYQPEDASAAGWPLANTVAQAIVWGYRVVGTVLGVGGLVCAVLVLARWLRTRWAARHSSLVVPDARSRELGVYALVLTALWLGVLCLVAALTYTRVSSFTPISYYYYGSAAYPLLLAFNLLAVSGAWRTRKKGASGAEEEERVQ